MATIRQNPVTGDYVVIATERAKRPKDFVHPKIDKKPDIDKNCPFCPQNIKSQKLIQGASTSNIYVVENLFPAFNLRDTVSLQSSGELYYSAHALGAHEVIIPKDHNKDLQDMTPREFDEVLNIYQKRIIFHDSLPYIGYSLVIHNHGQESGASVLHPHSQIFAPEVLPVNLKSEIDGSKNWYIKNNSCVFCDIVKEERALGQRMIDENEDYIAFAAYAPRFSGEVWIMPKYHSTRFEHIKEDSRFNLAKIFNKIIKKYDIGFGNPPYNYYVHTAPTKNYEPDRYYHFHIEILPRMSLWGGFELGAGMPIDVLLPESVAEFLRGIKV